MLNINPLLLVGGVIGAVTALLIFAYASVKDKKTAMGFERTMADGEILRRLFAYAKPYWAKFLLVLFLMLFSIAYDIISPLIVGAIEELVAADFTLSRLFASVAVYAGVLVFSMASTYFQAVILQRVGQRIISDLREDLFTHIESLSHEQLNEIPVGKLVTRVTNDTNAISMMFTNLLVNLIKNAFVILGILVAMLCLNYALTLMVLCFVPFIVIFTVIFRKFSRRAYRKVKDATTDINTYLSENLSGIKVTQIFGREDEKMAEFYQKSQTLSKVTQEQIFVFGVFRPLVYMLYISSILCLFYLGGMGHLNNVSFLGQTITGGTIDYCPTPGAEPVRLSGLKTGKDWLRIRGREIAMIMQDPMTSLNPLKTIGDQILEAVTLHQGLKGTEARARTLEYLRDVGISDPEVRFKQYPHEFSGGMRQRVVIAIAVACSPKILICDEPTTALDVTIQAQILQLLKELRAKYHLTIVMITHDLGVVANIADRVAVMYAGDIVEIGTADEIYYDPRHPYTWALLSSMPQMGIKGEDLFNIVGTPPNLFAEIRGDAFAPRNPQALKIDYVKRPPYFEVSPTHKAKTWLLDPRAPKVEMPPELAQRISRMKADAEKIKEAE